MWTISAVHRYHSPRDARRAVTGLPIMNNGQSDLTTEGNESPTDDSHREDGARHQQDASNGLPVDLDQVFGVLSNRRRRAILRYLTTESPEVEFGELAELLAARECDKDRCQISAQERKRLYIALYQSHLPKMADMDAIDYDERSGLVERGPKIRSFLEHLPAEEPVPTGSTPECDGPQ